jgi:uncharacterized phage protein (TIGR01671 family)
MRKIKFRGKRIDNGECVYGYYFQGFTGISYILVLHDHILGMTEFYEVDPETVGQYTGYKDECDEHEIYEGDILEFTIFDHDGADKQFTGVIKWANGMFEIWHDNEQEYYGSDGAFVLAWVLAQDDCAKVVGNIHDNPELLGGAE